VETPTDQTMIANSDDRWTRTVGNGYVVRATRSASSSLIERFMAGYDQAFVLPDEREEIEGFRTCLAINDRARHWFGRTHCELVMVLEDAAAGTVLGGANFLATRIPQVPSDHPPVAVALNYLFVESQARGRGLSRMLKQAVETLANEAVDAPASAVPPAMFIEQNDPLRLSAEDYTRDSAHSGIDQVDRLAVWAQLGAQLVDFPYVQPALSSEQRSDEGLAYAVMNLAVPAIDAAWFAAHLESFFAISALKGARIASDPVASGQLERLRDMAAVGQKVSLLSLRHAVEALRARTGEGTERSLRCFARALKR
jgi:GNAT superfamily N-acetyltransferase